jgi:hypothetical protein
MATYHLRFRGMTLQLAESSRQFVHGKPVTTTSQRTLRMRQTVQAWLARSRVRESGEPEPDVSSSDLEEPMTACLPVWLRVMVCCCD